MGDSVLGLWLVPAQLRTSRQLPQKPHYLQVANTDCYLTEFTTTRYKFGTRPRHGGAEAPRREGGARLRPKGTVGQSPTQQSPSVASKGWPTKHPTTPTH